MRLGNVPSAAIFVADSVPIVSPPVRNVVRTVVAGGKVRVVVAVILMSLIKVSARHGRVGSLRYVASRSIVDAVAKGKLLNVGSNHVILRGCSSFF